MSKTYDIGIIGAGVAGAFASLRIAEKYKNTNAILFELGRPPGKRRRQLEGWLGCLPFGDGKLYVDDIQDIIEVVDGRKAKPIEKWVLSKFTEAGPTKVVKDKLPSATVQKQAADMMFDLYTNDHIQWIPDNIHKLSRQIADKIEEAGNVEFSFDNEVFQILKQNDEFLIATHNGDFKCKKVLLCVGRSGWRWVTSLYKSFGLMDDEYDSMAKYGIRVEIPAQYMKDFHKSHCTLVRDDMEIGPLSWNGAIIPEDHADLVISAFRSNEGRWKRMGKNKVSFNLIGYKTFLNQGTYQTERLGKLAFLMFNDRVGREKIKLIMKGDSVLSELPEYNWLPNTLKELEAIFPTIITRGYYHAPTILPMAPSILLDKNLESNLENLYVAGESAGFHGIMASAISGTIAVDGALR